MQNEKTLAAICVLVLLVAMSSFVPKTVFAVIIIAGSAKHLKRAHNGQTGIAYRPGHMAGTVRLLFHAHPM